MHADRNATVRYGDGSAPRISNRQNNHIFSFVIGQLTFIHHRRRLL